MSPPNNVLGRRVYILDQRADFLYQANAKWKPIRQNAYLDDYFRAAISCYSAFYCGTS